MATLRIEVKRGGRWHIRGESESSATPSEIMEILTAQSKTRSHRAFLDEELVVTAEAGMPAELVETLPADCFSTIPRDAVLSRVYLIHGVGVPSKACVAHWETDAEFILHLANGKRSYGPYLHAEEIVCGLVQLSAQSHQEGDETVVDGIETLRWGRGGDAKEALPARRFQLPEDRHPEAVSAWLVTLEDGTTSMFVAPSLCNSFKLTTALSDDITGRYTVRAIGGGTMTLAADYLVKGWSLIAAAPPCRVHLGPSAMH